MILLPEEKSLHFCRLNEILAVRGLHSKETEGKMNEIRR